MQPLPSTEGKALTLKEALEEVEGHLLSEREVFAPALPSHISPDRFQSVIMTAIARKPELLRADRRSLLNACCQAAADGLLPDGREGALVIYKNKVKVKRNGLEVEEYRQVVQWMPMVRGVVKRMRQSGDVLGFRTRLVYDEELKQDRFSFRVIDGVEHLNHDPILVEDAGEIALVYAVAELPDGILEIEIMNRRQINRVKAKSKSKDKKGNFYGPWKDDEDEMWRKTVTHRIAKRLPLCAEVLQVVDRDDNHYHVDPDNDDLPPPDTQDLSVAARRLGAGARVEGAAAGQVDDAQIIDGEISSEPNGEGSDLSQYDDDNEDPQGGPGQQQSTETPAEKIRREGMEAAEGGTAVLRKWFDRLTPAQKKELLVYKDGTLKPIAAEADKTVTA